MGSSLYKGSHRTLFEAFLKLVDDSEAQTSALLDLVSWEDARSFLSIGGGKGLVEASLIRKSPLAKIWYLDPSPEQCKEFRQYMQQENLLERVEHVAEVTFQEYETSQKFDRILSIFSWYFIGANRRPINKLLDLLTPNGAACIVLPNTGSIFADFTRSISPDKHMTLVGDELLNVLNSMDCDVIQHTHTKWLANNDLFDGEFASEASLAFAAFVAMRSITTFTPVEKQHIVDLLNARRDAKGVPLKWDLLIIKPSL